MKVKRGLFKKNLNTFILVFVLLIILLGTGTILWQSRTRVDRPKSKAKEVKQQGKDNTPVSQWVPIPIKDYQQQLTTVINAAEKEKTKIKSERGQIAGKPELQVKDNRLLKRYALLDDSIKTLTEVINKEGKQNYIDTDQDNLISYQEFNAKTGNISQAVFNINQSKNINYDDGIYDYNWQKIEPKSLIKTSSQPINHVQVWVEGGIYDQILPQLLQYQSDIESCEDYQIDFYICNGCTKEEIKTSLQQIETVGTVFVGDLPNAWFYLYNCYDYGFYETFPVDLYFMDLNGSWTGGDGSSINPFKFHIEDIYPEIFFGRITSPIGTGQDEINLINNYFDKNHKYRKGVTALPHQALVYIDDDWAGATEYWGNQIGLVYSQRTQISDPLTTNAVDYKNRWDDNYEHLFVAVHSDPWEHGFVVNNDRQYVTMNDVKNNKPHFFFYNLFACSNARFSEINYIAGWYIFQESDYGLTAVGPTKIGGMLETDKFYNSLKNNDFGGALKQWFKDTGTNDQCWYYGTTLIGDPTLKTDIVCTTPTNTPTPTTPLPTPTLNIRITDISNSNTNNQVIFNQDSLPQIKIIRKQGEDDNIVFTTTTLPAYPEIEHVWVSVTGPKSGWVARDNSRYYYSPTPMPTVKSTWLTQDGPNDSYSWRFSGQYWPDGDYQVKVTAYPHDSIFGWIADSQVYHLTISTQTPTPTLILGTPQCNNMDVHGQQWGNSFGICFDKVQVTDSDCNLSQLTYYISSVGVESNPITTNQCSFTSSYFCVGVDNISSIPYQSCYEVKTVAQDTSQLSCSMSETVCRPTPTP
jgi:hypothetical protein